MFALGPVAFASPWILTALIGLPVIWWLLRVMPPVPQRVRFPAVRLLLDLRKHEETPAHTPWWLLLLRLVISATIIFALADPVLNPTNNLDEGDVLVVVIDDGWTSAAQWTRRKDTLDNLLAEAAREEKSIALIPTAPTVASVEEKPAFSLLTASAARGEVQLLEPKSLMPDRRAAFDDIAAVGEGLKRQGLTARVIWISDGIDDGAVGDLVGRLAQLGPVSVVADPPAERAWALSPPENTADGLAARLIRADTQGPAQGQVRVIGSGERLLGHAEFTFQAGAGETIAEIELPLELRNQAQRLEISDRRSAGAVTLLDDRWRRQLVGLVVAGNVERAQPLLSDLYYLEKAIAPYSEIRKGTLPELLEQNVSVLLLADVGQIVGDQKEAVARWVERGGLLVRFAGPRLAAQADDLVPVDLREGGRALGGALSWSTPQSLAAFEEASPFYGLAVRADVTVSRQVLAQPGIDLAQHTWAQLADGTPLVTAATRGKGRIVLFHITASPEWSTLPMSGLFVDMLRRVTALASGVAPASGDAASRSPTGGNLRPLRTLDGFGLLQSPPPTAASLSMDELAAGIVEPRHPPGLYGNDQLSVALNAVPTGFTLRAITSWPAGVALDPFADGRSRSLKPSLLLAALLLVLFDGLCAAALAGKLRPRVRRGASTAAMLIALVLLFDGHGARAQSDDDDAFALAATLETPLAYVVTGVPDVDRMSRAGLVGLSRVLRERTAMEPGPPMGVDIEIRELSFFPLLYWPVVEGQKEPTPHALAKIDAYMKNGGTILFDTQDHQSTIPGLASQAGNALLQRLLGSLDIPVLEPVPEDHVLTKAFYLLQDFPGRWSGGRVWVEGQGASAGADGERVGNDGVSAIIIGSNDYAAAWAEDDQRRPLAAVVPGGDRQRELAMRFGVNLVMYTLTGNYKADQVHVPALLERLGQ